jgi:hypothetical protein
MKRFSTIVLGVYVGCREFGSFVGLFAPTVGNMDSGFEFWQIILLGLLALPILVGVVSIGYETLNWLFE